MGVNPIEPAKPLSFWEKVKVGASSFVSNALSYLPRGLMFAGLVMGVSLLAGMAIPGADLLNVANTFNAPGGGIGAIAQMVGKTLLLGGLITGTMGAWQGVEKATQERNALRAQQAGILARHQGQGHAQHIAYEEPVSPQRGLPTGNPLGKHQTPTIV